MLPATTPPAAVPAAGQVVAEHVLVAPGEASVRDEHYGGLRPMPRRAVRPRTAAEKAFCALGPVAEAFITGAAAAGHTRLGPELAELNTLRAAHGEEAFGAALDRAVAFGRWRAADVRSIQAAGPGTADPRPAGDGPGARPDRGAGCPHSATCSPSPCHGIRHPRRWQRLSRGPVLRQADGGAATVGGLFSVPLSFRVLCDVRGVSELDKLWTLLTEAPDGGPRAGQPVHPREISFTAAHRAVLAAIRHGAVGYQALTSAISRCRIVIDRNRHRARKATARPAFGGAGRDTATRTAEAILTVCNTPA